MAHQECTHDECCWVVKKTFLELKEDDGSQAMHDGTCRCRRRCCTDSLVPHSFESEDEVSSETSTHLCDDGCTHESCEQYGDVLRIPSGLSDDSNASGKGICRPDADCAHECCWVVKKTFLELKDDEQSADVLQDAGCCCRRRCCTDSLLLHHFHDEDEVCSEPSTHESYECDGIFRIPSGLSDDSDSSGNGMSTPDVDEVGDLLAENRRLALENEALRERCLQQGRATPNAERLPPSPAPHPQPSPQLQPQQVPMMWVPMMLPPGCWAPGVAPQTSDPQAQAHSPAKASGHVQRRAAARRGMLEEDGTSNVEVQDRTTVMLRNLPNDYTRDMLVKMLNDEGFAGQFDFLYLPMDFERHSAMGYAFVNLSSPSAAARFWETFDGFSRWCLPSKKVCFVTWSGPHQGFAAHVERYRNSQVMHDSVPDEYKPVIFNSGVRVPFPVPTRKPCMPRARRSQ